MRTVTHAVGLAPASPADPRYQMHVSASPGRGGAEGDPARRWMPRTAGYRLRWWRIVPLFVALLLAFASGCTQSQSGAPSSAPTGGAGRFQRGDPAVEASPPPRASDPSRTSAVASPSPPPGALSLPFSTGEY